MGCKFLADDNLKSADGMNSDLTDVTWFTVRYKFAIGKLA